MSSLCCSQKTTVISSKATAISPATAEEWCWAGGESPSPALWLGSSAGGGRCSFGGGSAVKVARAFALSFLSLMGQSQTNS